MKYTKTYLTEDKQSYLVTDPATGHVLHVWRPGYGKTPRWEITPATITGTDGKRHVVRTDGIRRPECTVAGDITEARLEKRLDRAFREWGPVIEKTKAEVASWDVYTAGKRALTEELAAIRSTIPDNVFVRVVFADGFDVVVTLKTVADLQALLRNL